MATTSVIAQVNAEIKRLGYDSRLRRGRGYYYFDGDGCSWYSSSVYTCYSDDLTVAEWMKEFHALRTNFQNDRDLMRQQEREAAERRGAARIAKSPLARSIRARMAARNTSGRRRCDECGGFLNVQGECRACENGR